MFERSIAIPAYFQCSFIVSPSSVFGAVTSFNLPGSSHLLLVIFGSRYVAGGHYCNHSSAPRRPPLASSHFSPLNAPSPSSHFKSYNSSVSEGRKKKYLSVCYHNFWRINTVKIRILLYITLLSKYGITNVGVK